MTDLSRQAVPSRFRPEDRADLMKGGAFLVVGGISAAAAKTMFDIDPALGDDKLFRLVAILPAVPFVAALMSWFRFAGRQDELFQTKDGIALRVAVLLAAGFAASTTLLQEVAGRDPLPMLWTVAVFAVGYAFGWLCAWQKFR